MEHFSLSGTDNSLFISTTVTLQREQDMSICRDTSAQKNGIKGILYKSEPLTVKTHQNLEPFLFLHLLSLLPKEHF